jgi:PAS domain-containing protein
MLLANQYPQLFNNHATVTGLSAAASLHQQQQQAALLAALQSAGLGGASQLQQSHQQVLNLTPPLGHGVGGLPFSTGGLTQQQQNPSLGQVRNDPRQHQPARNINVGTNGTTGSANSLPNLLVGAGSVTANTLQSLSAKKEKMSLSLAQLEAQISLLQENNQHIPQHLALLLAEARKKEEKRAAKRVANRKSACTSRARKKALVEEMTRVNIRLKRQAQILALLPDLVIAITEDGSITFTSAQVERVLDHKSSDLLHSSIEGLLLPASREPLRLLIEELVAKEKEIENARNDEDAKQKADGSDNDGSEESAKLVSEQSFGIEVVATKPSNKKSTMNKAESSNSDAISSKGVSSITVDSTQSDETSNKISNASVSSDKETNGVKRKRLGNASQATDRAVVEDRMSPSDDSFVARKASEALNRNVETHNAWMRKDKAFSHKDDVIGASVTANNAEARLSSLQHRPESSDSKTKENDDSPDLKMEADENSNSSDSLLGGVEDKQSGSEDSGYRVGSDSLPSREESGVSSADEASNNSDGLKRVRPLAPTCNLCLIRSNLSSVWCEVTFSVRSKTAVKEQEDVISVEEAPVSKNVNIKNLKNSVEKEIEEEENTPEMEILLCFRPIREGGKVSEDLRFDPSKKVQVEKPTKQDAVTAVVSKGSDPSISTAENSKNSGSEDKAVQPLRQALPTNDLTKTMKSNTATTESEEQSVVESLMLMSNKTNNNPQ